MFFISSFDEIDNLCSKYEQKLDELVATTNQDLNLFFSDLSTRIPRFQECGLGDYCADSMMHVVGKSTNVDIAFLNGGGIRAPLKKGNVTFRDIISVNPFNNDIVVSELTGQQIMDMWEYFTKDVGERENASLMSVNGLKFDVYKNNSYFINIYEYFLN